jgi:Domain of unknown function DUF11
LAATGPATAADGTSFTEDYAVSNQGPGPALNVTTNAVVPDGVTVTGAGGATVDSGTLVWTDGLLAAGTTVTHAVTFSVDAEVDTSTTFGGFAYAVDDPDLSNNTAVNTIRLG